jgi:iron complex outermembrane receptor protein
MKSFKIRRQLRGGVSRAALLSVAALIAATAPVEAFAQDAAPAQDQKGDDDAIVVTGIRASLASAAQTKRNSDQVIDVISAEDIGKFPDKNIGEAIQRVTGVQLTRGGGEGQNVSIRGASPALTRVEINGQTTLSTGAGTQGRTVDFRELPAEFVSRVEVVKSGSADMTEGGLGGTVRIITRRPFDAKDGYLAGSAQTVYNEISKRWDPKFAVIGSHLFAHDTIGVLLSATYEQRSLWYDQARTTGWRQIDSSPAAGNQFYDFDHDGIGDFFPDIPRNIINREVTKRYAFNGIVEYRPTDDFKFFVDGTYARGKQTLDSQFLQLTTSIGSAGAGSGVVPSSVTMNPDNTVSHVVFNNITTLAIPSQLDVTYRNILGYIDRQTFNGQTGFDWQIGKLKVSARGAYATAFADNHEIDTQGDTFGISSLTVDYTNPQAGPNFTFGTVGTPGTTLNPTNSVGINRISVLNQPRLNHQNEYDGQLDLEYRPDNGGFLTSLKAGAQRRDVSSNSQLFSVQKIYNSYDGTTTLSITQRAGDNTVNPGTRNNILVPGAPTVTAATIQTMLAGATLGDHDFFSTGELGFAGIPRWLDLGLATANAMGIPDASTSPMPLSFWTVTDRNWAGYVQGAFKGGPISGVIGFRVVNTKTISTGNSIITTPHPAQVGPPAVPASATTYEVKPVTFTSEYTDFLPAVNLKAELVPNRLIARAAMTEVLARPEQNDLAPSFTLDVVGRTGRRGNPDLQPFRARQYDLGLEWYLNPTSYFSVAYFRKEISSFTFSTTQPETYDGILYTISLLKNSTQKVTINGFEAGGQVTFDFLPAPFNHLGAQANATFQKDKGFEAKDLITGGPLPFPGLSRTSYNASAFYEDSTVSLRVSYNWRDKYLATPVGRGNNPEFGEAYGQFDLSSSVNVTKNFQLFLDVVNITDATRRENANSIYRRTLEETFGRRVYIGVRGRF